MDSEAPVEWLQRQRAIAEQVIVLDDSTTFDVASARQEESTRFRHLTRRSFSTGKEGDLEKKYYGGVDVSFPAPQEGVDDRMAVAVYVIVDETSCEVVYQDSIIFELDVPYVPSFLAFREIDPLLQLVQRQKSTRPDLEPRAILVDGNGVWHPRGAGIACFLGVLADIPTIGVGKTLYCQGGWNPRTVNETVTASLQAAAKISTASRDEEHRVLWDSHVMTPSSSVVENDTKIDGESLLETIAPLCHGLAVKLRAAHPQDENKEVLVCALVGHGGTIAPGRRHHRRGAKNPIYVSVGHKISLEESVRLVATLSLARIPEPVRQADLMGREIMRKRQQAAPE